MTLVLTCLTHEAVLIISDRRLTSYPSASRPVKVVQEDATKAVFADHWLFGYTGLSRLEGKRTDLWLADRLVKRVQQHLSICVSEIMQDADRQISWVERLHPQLAPIAQAFIGAGWFIDPLTNKSYTGYYLVSNFHDTRGQPNGVGAFRTDCRDLTSNSACLVQAIGAGVAMNEIRTLEVQISRTIRRGGGPNAVGRHLFDFIQMISQREVSVGNRFILSCIPKASFERQCRGERYAFFSGLPERNHATFAYFDGDTGTTRQFAPTVVMNGSTVANFSTGPSEEL